MSARSAHVRKKLTQSDVKKPHPHSVIQTSSAISTSGSSSDGIPIGHPGGRPVPDYAYALPRRPLVRSEEGSTIDKSDFRSALDKKTDLLRDGIAKTFKFRSKEKRPDSQGRQPADPRPQSSTATVRPHPTIQIPNDAEFDEGSTNYFETSPSTQQSWQPISPRDLASPPPFPLPASTSPLKRWIGGGRPVQRWNKLRKDPELWDLDGDVLVYLGPEDQKPRQNPSFRLSSHMIEATGSRYLVMLLREGSTDDGTRSRWPLGSPLMPYHQGSHMSGSPGDYRSSMATFGVAGDGLRQPSPSESDDGEADGQISYKIYMPSPPNLTPTEQLRYHVTTRNVFALIYHTSLVGITLYQTLTDLHARLNSYMSAETDTVGSITQYLSTRGIDDVRGDAETASSLLAWSESPEVRWDEGWRESFLHCAGMTARVERCVDSRNITPITRALLERAGLESQLRVQSAEERLADFRFSDDIWPSAAATAANPSGPVAWSPAKGAADRLQSFFLAYYGRKYGCWPPLPPLHQDVGAVLEEDEVWLTRTVAQDLQRDFAALYEYLVDRDVAWDVSEARPGRKWLLVKRGGDRDFDADTADLPMTDMLVEFDNRMRYPHIPHPYPLVPESIPSPPSATATARGGRKGTKPVATGATTGRSNERRVALAYAEATNMLLLGAELGQSDLVDAFVRFEKADCPCEVDPATARRGRWVVIYGALQSLADVAVDAPDARYVEDVAYHLSPRLRGATRLPPWNNGKRGRQQSQQQDACHELSYCWLAPKAWAAASSSGTESDAAVEDEAVPNGGDTSPVIRGLTFPSPPSSGRRR